MKRVRRRKGEKLLDLVRRCYTVRWIDGFEQQERLERAVSAVREANPAFEKQGTVRLPPLPHIPYLETTVTEAGQLHEALHTRLKVVQADERLLNLSFIDPLRLGCEELGVAVTPAVALEVRRRLHGVLSFDQEEYVEVRDTKRPLHGISHIRWETGR
jgi:hypothetical protein